MQRIRTAKCRFNHLDHIYPEIYPGHTIIHPDYKIFNKSIILAGRPLFFLVISYLRPGEIFTEEISWETKISSSQTSEKNKNFCLTFGSEFCILNRH